MTDNPNANRPERRTALIARELRRYNIDIAALSETRLADEGQLTEIGGGYTFYWKGKNSNEPRIHGVGFAIKNELLGSLSEIPTGINERLMTLKIKLNDNQWATIISAYAPTLDADDNIKEAFYANLEDILSGIPQRDKIILLGDFNARVGCDNQLWAGIIGKDGVGTCNSNGVLLLTKCAEHELVITNTLFRQKNHLKTSWQHPRSKHWHLIDYIIVRKRDQKDVLVTRAMTGADDCWTDHRLIRSTMVISFKPNRRNQQRKTNRAFDVEKLKNPEIKQQFQQALANNLPQVYPENVKDHWSRLKEVIHSTCQETLGYRVKKHQDWFDENDDEIQSLIDKKRKAFAMWRTDINSVEKKTTFQTAKAEVQRRTRIIKNEWWQAKAREIQHLADTNNTRQFFQATTAIYGPRTQGLNPLKTRDGTTLIKDKESINDRWRDHFQELLNLETEVDEEIYNLIPQRPIDVNLGLPPTLGEMREAIKQTKKNKAAGLDGIPAEVFQEGGDQLIHHLHDIVLKIWETEQMPPDFRDALLVTIFKKGDKADCGNYRGISLLSIAGKIITRVLANRIQPLAEEILPESQCGFRPNRGTSDMIFTARQLQEKCREQNKPLYMAFIDLVKAFDSVNRSALWKILALSGCPPKFISVLRLLHDDMTAAVIAGGTCGEPFAINTGVKQGCIIAPTLFSIFISSIMHLIREDIPPGVQLSYRMDGRLFNLNRLRAKTKTSVTSVLELQYADDNTIVAETEVELQAILNIFVEAYSKIGLKLNIQKTKILHQPAPGENIQAPAISIHGEPLQNVNSFPYLGSHLSSTADIDTEIHHRIRSAGAAFGRLRERVFTNRDIRNETKIFVYNSVVIPTLLYGCETWTTYRRHIRSLEQYHQRCLRSILRVSWQDRRTNISILEEANTTSMEAMIIRHQLRWTGHVIRMPNHRLPKQILYSELCGGDRHVGKPKKRFKDTTKTNLRQCNINIEGWETSTLDRTAWRRCVYEGVENFEVNRRSNLVEKRAGQKRRQQQRMNNLLPAAPQGNTCQHCGRVCASRIGLISHLRTHQ